MAGWFFGSGTEEAAEHEFFRSDVSVARASKIRCQLGGCGCAHNTFVWVSDLRRAIYLEVPRAASTTMRSLITGDDARFSLVDESPDEAVEGRPEYFSFTVIREPVDRFRSNFELFCRSDRPMRVQQARALFGRPPDRIEPEEFFDLAARYWNHHWESMTRFLPSDPGILDHISTLESLADDWNFLSRRLSIHQGLPRHNRGRRDAARWSPTLELANNIGRRYSQDVRLYDTVSASRSDSDPTSGGA